MLVEMRLCDDHDARGERIEIPREGSTHYFTLDKESIEVDLCDTCLEQWVETFERIKAIGHRPAAGFVAPGSRSKRKTEENPPAAGDQPQSDASAPTWACRYKEVFHDGDCERNFSTPQGRAMHERQGHSFNMPDWIKDNPERAEEFGVQVAA